MNSGRIKIITDDGEFNFIREDLPHGRLEVDNEDRLWLVFSFLLISSIGIILGIRYTMDGPDFEIATGLAPNFGQIFSTFPDLEISIDRAPARTKAALIPLDHYY